MFRNHTNYQFRWGHVFRINCFVHHHVSHKLVSNVNMIISAIHWLAVKEAHTLTVCKNINMWKVDLQFCTKPTRISNYTTSQQVSLRTMYSALHNDSATIICFLKDKTIQPPAILNRNALVDFRSSPSPAHAESLKPVGIMLQFFEKRRAKCLLSFMHTTKHFTAIHCLSHEISTNLDCIPAANAMPERVFVIRFIKQPIASRYEILASKLFLLFKFSSRGSGFQTSSIHVIAGHDSSNPKCSSIHSAYFFCDRKRTLFIWSQTNWLFRLVFVSQKFSLWTVCFNEFLSNKLNWNRYQFLESRQCRVQ